MTKMPTPGEAGLLVAIVFGLPILLSLTAVANGFPANAASFSDAGLMGLFAMEIVFGTLALAFLHFRGYQLRDMVPAPTWTGTFLGAGICVAGALASQGIAQFFSSNQLAVQPIAQMVANAHPSLMVVLALSLLNGWYEETFLMAYLVRGFEEMGPSFALGLATLVRLMCHLYQGPVGALQVTVFGLVVSAVYWRTRQLWPAVAAHQIMDAVALHSFTG